MNRIFSAALAALVLVAGPTVAQDFQPAILFDMGGKFDKSFNEAAYNGAERFKDETGIAYTEFELTNPSQRDQAIRRMARRGASIVVTVGFNNETPLQTIAAEYPDTKFVIVDAAVDQPNVRSIVFKEHEGSFLVGMAAALASKTNAVGFVGGMDIPLIHKFQAGYEQGAKHVKADVTTFAAYAGNTEAAWNDPTRGAELAQSQFDRGADVVYHAAGNTGLGVLQAAADGGKLAIGVDSNQNYLYPGTVLTSMVKRVELAVYDAFKTAQDGTWTPGTQTLGLKEDAVGYALDDNNRTVLTPAIVARLEEAKKAIIEGRITVVDPTVAP